METYLVGGAVRDELLGLDVTEKDWVVVGASEKDLLDENFKKVGKDFPVFIHPQTKEEYALARLERKSGKGHKGFDFNFDPSVTLEEDLMRRDLTINAIAKDTKGNFIDPYGGLEDLNNRILRKVSSAFSEDPLRVFRVARFHAKLKYLDFKIEEKTLEQMQAISSSDELGVLSKERIWGETQKALRTQNPEEYFITLEKVGALEKIINFMNPNLRNLSQASSIEDDISILWSVLISGNTNLDEINLAFGVPKEFTEISAISEKISTFNKEELKAEPLLKLLLSCDLIRKPERFLKAQRASSLVSTYSLLNENQWKEIFALVTKIEIDKSENNGKIIAKKLYEDRLVAIENYIRST